MKIGLVIPTRGLIFTEAITSAMRQLMDSGIPWDFKMPSILPIPDCFNIPISSFIQSDEAISHIWLVEEDVISPFNALERLISLKADISVIDYPLRTGWGTIAYLNKDILWSGTGCMLVKREVFNKIGYPYFKPATYWIKGKGIYEYHPEIKNSYGGHDIQFGLECREKGIKIKEVKDLVCEHLQLVERGKSGDNNGTHTIKRYKEIKQRQKFTHFHII